MDMVGCGCEGRQSRGRRMRAPSGKISGRRAELWVDRGPGRGRHGPDLGSVDAWLESTCTHGPDPAQRHLLAPNDLQVVKAAGVTFAASMVERVIEEQARGDAARADTVRRQVVAVVGDDLAAIRP